MIKLTKALGLVMRTVESFKVMITLNILYYAYFSNHVMKSKFLNPCYEIVETTYKSNNQFFKIKVFQWQLQYNYKLIIFFYSF